MGMIDRFMGASSAISSVANAATGVAEVFHQNATRRMELDEKAFSQSLSQYTGEFSAQPRGRFDDFVNGLNRLPRPMLTMGTVGLFIYAMVEPVGFGLRMENLNLVPEPMWWLLGAIISFYFGARETHYLRNHRPFKAAKTADPDVPQPEARPSFIASDPFGDNAALRDWIAETARM
ncbi:holin family protein [Paracoccus sp. MBLB3053]|uniref:Holin family protein n=1 Tax=Paracoccus aurantius TaxID=3073814 RepID=A0ABU2HTN2_9RHOB|nr:holin family protein [Paracoccus sp. MBLB3053]MDS9468415.1 holin family protein [Paracoccus sp. MBLB3053]